MFDKYVICTRDFRNVSERGAATGFQLLIRIPYYRGVYVSLVESIRLRVDGEEFPREAQRLTVGTRTMTMDEAERATDVRWFFGDPAILTVSKAGGLAPGMHTVQVDINIRRSYVPKTDPEGLFPFVAGQPLGRMMADFATKKITLVQ